MWVSAISNLRGAALHANLPGTSEWDGQSARAACCGQSAGQTADGGTLRGLCSCQEVEVVRLLKDLNWIPGSQHSSTIRWQHWIQVVADGARRDKEKPFLRCALISWEWEFTCDTPLLRRMPLFTGALRGSGRIRSWRPGLPSYEDHLSVTCPVHVDIIRKRLAVLSCSIRSESPSCMLATKGILASSAKRMFRYAVAHTCLHVMWFAQNGQGGKCPYT